MKRASGAPAPSLSRWTPDISARAGGPAPRRVRQAPPLGLLGCSLLEIAMFTPADVHYGRAGELLDVRAGVLDAAYAAHPERFVKGPPLARPVPAEVWINRPLTEVPQA